MKTLTPILLGILLSTTAQAQTSRQIQSSDVIPLLPAYLFNTYANVGNYNAPANTKRVLGSGVNATVGSTTVATGNLSFISGDTGKNIVIAGLGLDVVQSAAINAAGTGNAVGDVLTLSAPGCATPPKLTVQAVSSGAVLLAVPTTPGSCAAASLPSNPVSVSSTTGSGTSAKFNLTWAAGPLQTTISGVSGSSVILAAPSQQTVSSGQEWFAWGNDDAPAINSALASGAYAVIFPSSATYGIFSPLNLPHESRINLECNGATIVALAPMAAMLNEIKPTDFWATEGSTVQRCRLDGMGLAQLNVSHKAFKWSYRDNILMNATVGNLYVGDAGSGSGENTLFSGNHYQNDLTVVGAYPLYNVSVNYSDNHFSHEIGFGAVNNFIDNSAGTYWSDIHGYQSLSSNFIFSGFVFATSIYADGVPDYMPGIQITGYNTILSGWDANGLGANSQGVYLQQQNGYNIITNGQVTGTISAANAVARSWGAGSSNVIVVNNLGTQYQNVGSTVAAGSATCPSGTVGGQTVQGCLVQNVAGTTRYIPYF